MFSVQHYLQRKTTKMKVNYSGDRTPQGIYTIRDISKRVIPDD